MPTPRTRQRGEGKVGCIISLVVLLVLGGAAAKLVPYWWDLDQFFSSADELASRAGTIASTPEKGEETIKTQLMAKARELELPEAARPGAVTVSVTSGGDSSNGRCTIRIKFSRTLDFYGLTSTVWATDKTIAKPWGKY
jgi:hypothetical protein